MLRMFYIYKKINRPFFGTDCASRLGHLFGRFVTAEGLGRSGVLSGRVGHIDAALATHGA